MNSYDLVLGGQWGDEGKAKMIDFISRNYQVIVRYQGGANAGHTIIVNQQKIILHHLPSGIFNPNTINVLGQGMVINLSILIQELEKIKKYFPIQNKIFFSQNAFVVFDYHLEIDKKIEGENLSKIGTTIKGIGPAYRDKVSRIGIRLHDFFFPAILKKKLTSAIQYNQNWLNPKRYTPAKIERLIKKNYLLFKKIKSQVIDTTYFLNQLPSQKILLEGAQGTGLDLDFGTYPYVTSSSPSIAGVSSGTGIPPNKIKKVVGIFKSYITRVGSGPLPTKLKTKKLIALRKYGDEFGATTGRPRDCGWFDCVQAKYTIMINGLTHIALTKLDVFDNYPTIKIATHYLYRGKKINYFPIHYEVIKKVKPVFKEFPTWSEKIFGINHFSNLPKNAQKIILFLEKKLNCPIKYISTGPAQEHTIVR